MSAYRTVAFWTNEKPFGKQRARTLKNGRSYTPRATVDAQQAIQQAWRDAGATTLPDHTPIDAMLEFYLVRPNSHYRRDGTLSAEGLRHPTPCRTKPDVDNATKLVLDALEDCAYTADVAIVNLTVFKAWDEDRQGRIWVSLQTRAAA